MTDTTGRFLFLPGAFILYLWLVHNRYKIGLHCEPNVMSSIFNHKVTVNAEELLFTAMDTLNETVGYFTMLINF